MIYRCYVTKGSGDDTDWQNHIGDAVEIRKFIYNGVTALSNISYGDLASKVDGEVVKWSDIKYRGYEDFYELWLEVED